MSASPEPLTTRLQLRWGDTDSYGHVNNVVWVRYLEEVRIRLFGLPDQPAAADPEHPPVFSVFGPGCFTVTVSTRIEYRNELVYHGQSVRAEAWLSRIGSSSVAVSFSVTDEAQTVTYVAAESTQAVRELATRTAHRFTEEEVAVLSAHLAPPHEYR